MQATQYMSVCCLPVKVSDRRNRNQIEGEIVFVPFQTIFYSVYFFVHTLISHVRF